MIPKVMIDLQLPLEYIDEDLIEAFENEYNCNVICVMTPWIADIVRNQYPKIKFIKNMGLSNICNQQTFFMTVPKVRRKTF